MLFILPSASYRIADFVDAARALGVDAMVATEGHQVLAAEMGDRLIGIDLTDPEKSADRIVAAAGERPIDAIVPVDDEGVLVAALAGEALGLIHNPPDAVAATRDKAALRNALAGVVAQPEYAAVRPADDPRAAAVRLGYPVVVKPTGLSASIGVIRADDPGALDAALDTLRTILRERGCPPGEPVLIERYVDGPEVSIDGLVQNGQWRTLAVFDKPDPMQGPHFAETLFITPSRHDPDAVQAAEDLAAAAVDHLGLRTGAVHAELRLTASGPVLIELAARTIGGLCSRALRFGLAGSTVEQLVIRNALGERLRATRREATASGVAMIPPAAAGTVRDITGVDEAVAIPDVTAVELTTRPGDAVAPLPHDGTYLGFVFARAAHPEAVEAALRAALDRIRISIA